jgi:predicted MFS family arabinose efflux permease
MARDERNPLPPPAATPDQREREADPGPLDGSAVSGRGGLGPLRVLRHREFAIYWVGLAISMVGTWMQSFAQGWVVAGLTSSAFMLGLVHFAMSAPTLFFMPLGGVLADQKDRRRILLVTNFSTMLLALVLGVLVATGALQFWHVLVVAALLGVTMAYELPAYQSFYPQLVDREDLPQAVSLNQATFHAARIVGPAFAGGLVAIWGIAAAFFANAATFLAPIVSLLLIRPRPPVGGRPPSSTLGLLREGLSYVKERPALQSLLTLTATTTLFVFPNVAFLAPYYVRYVLREGAAALGVMMSAAGIGAFLGAALLLSVSHEQRLPRMGVGIAVVALGLSVLAWARHLWLVVPTLGVMSLATAHVLGLVSIMVQETIPDAIRGRVMSLYSLMFTGIMPFGALILPAVADWLGMRVELQLAAVLYGLAAFATLARLRRHQAALGH